MPVVGGIALFGLPPAGRGQRGGRCHHGADRPAVSGQAVLRLTPDGGMAGHPGSPGQPQASAAADAVDGLVAVYQRPNTSKPAPENKVYPYLLGGMSITRVNQVWCADITYIPMARGFLYLVVIMDWVSRAVLGWRLSNTLGADFCIEALEEALVQYGKPEIFNTDQGCQFTSTEFTGALKQGGITISMDGKGRCMDNIFVERLWRSLKYEEVYLHAYASLAEAKAGGYVDDRLCRPAPLPPLPEQARKAGKCSPSPTSPQAPQPAKDLILIR